MGNGEIMTVGLNRPGYCKACIKNTPHHRYVQSYVFRIVDHATSPLTFRLGIGPWYCSNCDRRSWILGKPDKNAASIDFQDSGEPGIEKVGNFIRSDHSLVVRRARSSRYSQKYRDGVVTRLISGNVSIYDLSRELNISDRDLVDWIADMLSRKQEKIDELNRILSAMQQNSSQQRIGLEPVSFEDDERVVEGKLQMP